MEHCPYGDLRTFLRGQKDFYDVQEMSLTTDPLQKLGPRILLVMVFQIAKGIEFLISRKV